MADRSPIEWTDATWNPVRARAVTIEDGGGGRERTGWHCEHVSEGCRNCYAERINLRLGTTFDYKPGNLKHQTRHGDPRGDVEIFLDEKMLMAPLKWRRQRMIFVGSMTDLFAEFVTDAMLDRVFAVAGLAAGHNFQFLTKRGDRARRYLSDPGTVERVGAEQARIDPAATCYERVDLDAIWPLSNVWLGVSVEDQAAADVRVRHLLNTPAAVRFLSCEPLLGPLDLARVCLVSAKPGAIRAGIHLNALAGRYWESGIPYVGDWDVFNIPAPPPDAKVQRLDWVICGGESGGQARPMHPDWARALRDQCAAAEVPFFFKQWGAWGETWSPDRDGPTHFVLGSGERTEIVSGMSFPDGAVPMRRMAKARAGRILDGAVHDGMPA